MHAEVTLADDCANTLRSEPFILAKGADYKIILLGTQRQSTASECLYMGHFKLALSLLSNLLNNICIIK